MNSDEPCCLDLLCNLVFKVHFVLSALSSDCAKAKKYIFLKLDGRVSHGQRMNLFNLGADLTLNVAGNPFTNIARHLRLVEVCTKECHASQIPVEGNKDQY